ncbi:glycosyltransferase family 2 protein [Pedobacter glucosidilyticus]|uniref:glycosyltransferase family 2 protein n=1 Tax=Pedobacter glucosidilyticus TaxID=1122941 RepID=UPI00138ACE7E|nr:glycosyltransferase family 2 protein [Pedobacter glucosidilyticus]
MDVLEKNKEKIYCDVSVIIPCYNCSSTIERSINSILNQTRLPREVILVDDKSTDNTLEILNHLAKKHEEIPLIILSLSENSGPGIARNRGWKRAKYPWLAFLDADDLWHSQKLEIQTNVLGLHPDVYLCGHNSDVYSEFQTIPKEINFSVSSININKMLISNRFPTRSVMLRKDLDFKFGGKDVTEDYLLWLQIIADGYKAVKVDLILAYSLRPEFSKGGYSGQLWKHELRELRALRQLYSSSKIPFYKYFFFLGFSFMKFLRRLIIAKFFQ